MWRHELCILFANIIAMRNENEDTKYYLENKDGTWIGHIKEEIDGNIENIDTDFPLSGGEEPQNTQDKSGEIKEDSDGTSFSKDLDTEFPLSGGETER